MKRSIVMTVAALFTAAILLASCQLPNSGDTTSGSSSKTLTVTKTQTLAGYTLAASESIKAVGAKDSSTITYSSSDANVTTDTTALSGKAAYLNTSNGNVTPLGSTSVSSVTIAASDSSSGASGSIVVPIDVIAFASASGKDWNTTVSGVGAVTLRITAKASAPTSGTFSGVSTLDLSTVSGIKTIVPLTDQLNAGYASAYNGTTDIEDFIWFALDNKIYLASPDTNAVNGVYEVPTVANGAVPVDGFASSTPLSAGTYSGAYVVCVPVTFSTDLSTMTWVFAGQTLNFTAQ